MPGIEIQRTIKSPPKKVFDVVAHLDVFAEAIPSISWAECLTEIERGVGCRYEVARMIGGRERSTVFEVVEYEPVDYVRIISDIAGATWDASFTLEKDGKGTGLTWRLDPKPASMKARLAIPLLIGTVERALEPEMDAIKSYCEAQG